MGGIVVRRLVLLLLALHGPWAQSRARADDAAPFEWKDGDRVVLIGDALIEREQKSGYLETFVTVLNPGKTITFRNLGWSGDTPWGLARAGFGKEVDGFKHLVEHVLAIKPTVLIVGYGMTDSFDGPQGVTRFREGMNRLLDAVAPSGARLLLLSPIAHEDLGRPLPDPLPHNQNLRLYRDAIRDIAHERNGRFVDMFDFYQLWPSARQGEAGGRWDAYTDDGIHLDQSGYWSFGYHLNSSLGETAVAGIKIGADGKARWVRRVLFAPGGKLRESDHATVAGVTTIGRGVRFELTNGFLSPPSSPQRKKTGTAPLVVVAEGLPPGQYVLSIDGRPVARGSAAECVKKGLIVASGPEEDQVERLRQAVVEKNLLYFYRWRPQNETYLFGFRKHEQGNNAREIPLFDPLVEEKEQEIARLKVPVKHVYELIREGEEAK
jgi:hypothetical protein